jgi:hypothetical protein
MEEDKAISLQKAVAMIKDGDKLRVINSIYSLFR